MSLTLAEAGRALASPAAYADDRRFHEALALLRRESPVHWVEAAGYNPFWAVTRHADVMEVERAHTRFLNAPRPVLGTAEYDHMNSERAAQGAALRTLVHMDDPDHRVIRAIGADWFRPRAMRALEPRVRELARRYVDRMAELGGECDFVRQVSVHFPLYVILSLLGLPETDFDRMLKLTQELFGGDDDERQRGVTLEEKLAVLLDFFAYFQELTQARRAHPTDDLASAIANARVDGEPLNDSDAASYYVIIATAGHDTTSATIAGGLRALIEHPDQLARLRADPGLMPLAVDEMIRWTTPVKEFMRTATEDCELRGVRIRKGDALLLSYPSANRDEEVFDDPFRFDVGRDPNKHLAFGFGVHYCLGAALARIEVRAFYEELLPRLESIEFAGEPQNIATTFVGGLKRLPIRYTLRG
ncbi:cytochrome P450 [Actinomadura macrotermitis]|uniref:Cytochrome P450-terp n=1 Tax=Actinomadura macrotermitis TaxID=2585200 RepID=A0A7K0BWZ2_9ACTN|nr:cytochrome P450 [Actinomadura macrotermitis]MQY05701.1 Cytochrome P450-terp [Actinomadura macrotermitis]